MSQQIALPDAFLETHYSHAHVAKLMGLKLGFDISEPVFLSLVSCGKVPPGVNLMPVLGLPLLVWPREDIDAWIMLGCPLPTELIERERRVRAALSEALAEVGETLPDYVASHPAELN